MAVFRTSLLDIPPEIFDLIACYIGNKPDLLNVSRTCKQLHRLTLSRIYNHIQWSGGSDHKQRSFLLSFYLFARTILHNPDLGNLIEHLHFDGHTTIYEVEPYHSPLTDVEIALALDRARPLKPADTWRRAINAKQFSAYFALILTSTPRLLSLQLVGLPSDRDQVLDELITSVFMHCPPLVSNSTYSYNLAHLHDLFLDQSTRLSFRNPLMFFYLPQLEHAIVELIFLNDNFHFPSLKPRVAALMELHLPMSNLAPSILADLLTNSPPLKALGYSFVAGQVSNDKKIDLASLSRAISLVSSTLEIVDLHVAIDEVDMMEFLEDSPNSPFRGRLEGLERCEKLEDVDIDLMMIADWGGDGRAILQTQLPPNLKRLRLYDEMVEYEGNKFEMGGLLAAVKMWCREKQLGKLPGWEMLEVDFSRAIKTWKEETEKLLTTCSFAAVQASVDSTALLRSDMSHQQWSELYSN